MISKNSEVMYLFDFDGTLVGDTSWKSFWKNTWHCIKAEPYLNPTDHDIRWCVLTGRPMIDKLLVRLICNAKGMFPEIVYTLPKLFFGKTTHDEVLEFKLGHMKKILDGSIEVPYTPFEITKVFYVDSDLDAVSFINRRRGEHLLQAMSPVDFLNENFDFIWHGV